MQHMFFILHFTQPALVTVHILKKDILMSLDSFNCHFWISVYKIALEDHRNKNPFTIVLPL
jgi:hypothetical protein